MKMTYNEWLQNTLSTHNEMNRKSSAKQPNISRSSLQIAENLMRIRFKLTLGLKSLPGERSVW